MLVEPPGPVEIFYSYAHEDEVLRNQLEKHLTMLKRQGLISGWYDRLISVGTDWAREIDIHLDSAQIILLLVSADFMYSEYCYGIEMKRALERHSAGEARIIPIILRPVDWQFAPFGKFQALPAEGRPIVRWPDRDEAFADVAMGIRKVIETLSKVTPQKSPQFHPLSQTDGAIQDSAAPSSWSRLGSIGALIAMYVTAQQWERAEETARSIEDVGQRALALLTLVSEEGKAQQWVRAETVARSIEVRLVRAEAFCNLVGTLSNAKEWVRAETIARAIEDSYYRRKAFEQLSDALTRAGEWGRASALARSAELYQTPSLSYESNLPYPNLPAQSTGQQQSLEDYGAFSNEPRRKTPPSPSSLQRHSSARRTLSWVAIAFVTVGILIAIIALRWPLVFQMPMFYIVLVIGIVVIWGIIAYIRGRRLRY